jgi:hypothetical protein
VSEGTPDDPDEYVTLITSLPTPESLFRSRQTPLSRIRLEERLKMLRSEDAAELSAIEDVLAWNRLALTTTDADVAARAGRTLRDLRHEATRAIVAERLEIRTAMASLRRRAAGRPAPARDEAFGVGPLTDRIRAGWSEPAFGLERRMPWLPEAARLVADRDAAGLERLLLDVAWRRLKRREGEHVFDFVAVVVYVLKWHIVDRWTRQDETDARHRFEALADAALAAHGPVAFAEP